jgi:hypothetical protein
LKFFEIKSLPIFFLSFYKLESLTSISQVPTEAEMIQTSVGQQPNTVKKTKDAERDKNKIKITMFILYFHFFMDIVC